jgi:hypothetical protein
LDERLRAPKRDQASGEAADRAIYATSVDKLLALMSTAGFEDVKRLGDVFYQPVLVGTTP